MLPLLCIMIIIRHCGKLSSIIAGIIIIIGSGGGGNDGNDDDGLTGLDLARTADDYNSRL